MVENLPAVDAFLIHWNAPQWCLASVDSLLGSEGVALRVTVINNGGNLQLPHDVPVVDSPNHGFSGGANRALDSLGSAPLVFIGCHDVVVEPSTLRALACFLDEHPDFGIVGPVLNGGGVSDTSDEWVSGTGMLIRREVAERYRFDERYGSYLEDVDYCIRVRQGGWKVGQVPDARARTNGSVDERRAFVLMNANMAALFSMYRLRRQWSGQMRHLLKCTAASVVRRDLEGVRRNGHAASLGLVRSVTMRHQLRP